MTPVGTIFTVIDGHAYGWRSAELYERVHGWTYRTTCTGPDFSTFSCRRRIMFTRVQTVDWIAQRPPWSDQVGLVSNSLGTVAIYDRGELIGVPSAYMMLKYKLEWDRVRRIPDDEWNNYPMPIILS